LDINNRFEYNGETFTRTTFNGIPVVARDKDGYISATELCKQFHADFKKIEKSKAFRKILKKFEEEHGVKGMYVVK
jgi:hypothetical protein